MTIPGLEVMSNGNTLLLYSLSPPRSDTTSINYLQQLTPWSWVRIEKLRVAHTSSQEMPRIIWNLKFHYRVHKRPILNQVNEVHTRKTISERSTLILSSHLRLGLLSGLFRSDFLTKTLYAFLISPMPCLSHPPWFDHPICEEYKRRNSWLCRFFTVTSLYTSKSKYSSLTCPRICYSFSWYKRPDSSLRHVIAVDDVTFFAITLFALRTPSRYDEVFIFVYVGLFTLVFTFVVSCSLYFTLFRFCNWFV